jgi:glucosamine-6-phosphate deaminase
MASTANILSLKGDQLKSGKIGITILPTIEACMLDMAASMITEIEANNNQNKPTLLIVPVGPVLFYPYFIKSVNQKQLSLKNVTFLNMDEYMLTSTELIPYSHKLSFRRFMDENCYNKISPNLIMPKSQRIFPTPENANQIEQLILDHGSVDACYGGIGINGHVAFNEPPEEAPISEEEYLNLSVRVQKISRETKVVNAISDLGGAYENIPDYCVTLGYKQILASRKIRLYCFRNWHHAAIRKAAFGEKTVNFPVSLLQSHENTLITIPQELA